MKRPNQEQVNAAIAILTEHNSQYGAAASETMKQQCVYSILSALGGPGTISAEFAMAVENSMQGIDADATNCVIVSETTASLIGIDAGRYVLETNDEEQLVENDADNGDNSAAPPDPASYDSETLAPPASSDTPTSEVSDSGENESDQQNGEVEELEYPTNPAPDNMDSEDVAEDKFVE